MDKPTKSLRQALNASDFQTPAEKRIKAEILENAKKLNNASRANSGPFTLAISNLLLELAVAELEPETCPTCGGEIHPCR
jgi:hypothetical protein